jgi:hypothetical protein
VEDATLSAVILFNALHGVADDAVAMRQTGEAERKRRARTLTRFLEQALHPAEDDSAD